MIGVAALIALFWLLSRFAEWRAWQNGRPGVVSSLAAISAIGLFFLALLCLPLLIAVWLPDVIFAPRHILAEKHLASGYSFQVIQYWNRCDFYSTDLLVTSPDGRPEIHMLDGDDGKSWRLPMAVDEERRTFTVNLGFGRVKKVDW